MNCAERFDLAVIGGGPAGCAAAITAARAGARVLVLERGHFPRHKVCGEFVSAESKELLMSLLATTERHIIAKAFNLSNARVFVDDRILQFPIAPAALSIARYDLDAALWNSCIAAGITGVSEISARQIEHAGPFRIVTDKGTFEAASLINASGRWSNFTNCETRSRASKKWLGIKAHFLETQAVNSVDLYFFEGGYCGVQPISSANGRGYCVNACAMVRADVARTMQTVPQQHPKLHSRSLAWEAAINTVTTCPLFFHQPEPVHNGMIQVGDAANFVDPFIGDGISLALRSGKLAAECLVPFFRRKSSLKQAQEQYRRDYRRRFGRVFHASSLIRGFFGWPRVARKPLIYALEKSPQVANQIVQLTR